MDLKLCRGVEKRRRESPASTRSSESSEDVRTALRTAPRFPSFAVADDEDARQFREWRFRAKRRRELSFHLDGTPNAPDEDVFLTPARE